MLRFQNALISLICTVTVITFLIADDWTGFRGPRRDGKSAEKGLLEKWPEGGPKLVWTINDAGAALSGMSISSDRLFTMGQLKDGQYVLCYSLKDGKLLWSKKRY